MTQRRISLLILSLLACSLFAAGSAGAAEVLYVHPNGVPGWVRGELGIVELPRASSEDPEAYFAELYEAIEPAFHTALREHMTATGDEDFPLFAAEVDAANVAHLSFRQTMSGLPVVGSGFRAQVDLDTGTILGINGQFYPTLPEYDLRALTLMSFEDALVRALAEIEQEGEVLEPSELVFLGGGDRLEIAYRVLVRLGDGAPETLYVDAVDGSFLQTEPTLLPGLPPWPWPPFPLKKQQFRSLTGLAVSSFPPYDNLQLCYTQLAFPLPGFAGAPASPCTWDASVARAHDWAIDVFKYYRLRHQRSSWDGSYAPLVSVAHYLQKDGNGNWGTVANAFWNQQTHRMYYGDGDGNYLLDLTLGFDVAAHELTHGVTEATSALAYSKEPGALNEAMSDIFAAAAEAWKDGAITADTWRIGEDVAGPSLGVALRYMNNPTLDGYSADYYPQKLYPGACSPNNSNDYCGVHGNSGIANLAFYLMVQGGSHPQGKTSVVVPAIGMDKAEKIFYKAQSLLNPGDGFALARLATEQAAADLFDSATATAVSLAWDAVGVP
jgi:Zn-dependent metalloprotease